MLQLWEYIFNQKVVSICLRQCLSFIVKAIKSQQTSQIVRFMVSLLAFFCAKNQLFLVKFKKKNKKQIKNEYFFAIIRTFVRRHKQRSKRKLSILSLQVNRHIYPPKIEFMYLPGVENSRGVNISLSILYRGRDITRN